jgi:radical SAM superfamily enzyme YgiQ (UPF0313 family)
LDGDDPSVFDTTVEWAIAQGIETATFHLLTPYPGTDLFRRYSDAGRMLHRDWNLYDTRHVVFSHPKMSAATMEAGYWRAYQTFYRWNNIVRSGLNNLSWGDTLRHVAYVGAWKKFDPLWAILIKLRQLNIAVPALENILKGKKRRDNFISDCNVPETTIKDL